MKLKSIKEEIFILLRKSEAHQRALGRLLGTNQTNIRRALLDLEKNNIVDKKEVGRSKNYFIKDSMEAVIYERGVENYKLLKIFQKSKIRNIFKEIWEKIISNEIDAELIIVLFGSYSKNAESKNSDVDIYINSNSRKDKKLIEEISAEINVVQGSFEKKDPLFNEIKRDHIILNNSEGFLNLIR